MEEYVDILDEQGIVTGEVITKKEAHKVGKWHRSIHVMIISEDNKKILLQKRCPLKDLFPNMWDISVGGHVSSGEDTLVAAKRELSEELGLNPDDYDLVYVDEIKENFVDGDIISNEFVTIYKIINNVNINGIKLQKEEVSEVKWFTKNEVEMLIKESKIIPHIGEFDLISNILGD